MSIHGAIWKRLYAVPKNEIVKSLRSKLTDEVLIEMFETIDGSISTLEQIRQTSHQKLIQIAEAATSFTEEDARRLHEEFRYRGTKTLYLGYFSGDAQRIVQFDLNEVEIERVNSIVKSVLIPLASKKEALKFEQIYIREVDIFDFEDSRVWEITYSYITIVRTTDPKTEESEFHYDLRYGFVWINCTKQWVAISAKDEVIARIFVEVIQTYFACNISRLPIPKDVELSIESYEKLRRAAHMDGRGVRIRISHENLHNFPEEVAELQHRDRSSERTSSGYNMTCGDINFVLNYSRDKGAISLSKFLPTSMLREFGVAKINEIYDAIQDFKNNSPEILVSAATHRALLGKSQQVKVLIEQVISKLASARQHTQSDIDTGLSPIDLAKLVKWFKMSIQIECEYCDDEQQEAKCSCGNDKFKVKDDRVVCSRCLVPVESSSITCALGHEVYLSNGKELITLYPTQELYEIVEDVTLQAGQSRFSRYEENFYIRNTRLHVFGEHGNKTVYQVGDIPELQALATGIPSSSERDQIYDLLNSYKEKCDKPSHENCSACVLNKIGSNCLIRLHGLFDSNYTPRPHYNGEFGDVALNVTIDGRHNQTMVILLKSGKTRGHRITGRHGIGKDISTQLDLYWNDPRVAIIGIGVPQKIEDGFVAALQNKAQEHNKKLIFFGPAELANMIHHVTTKHNLNLEDL